MQRRGVGRPHIVLDRTTMPSSSSNPLDTRLQFPTQSENDSPTKLVPNSPRKLVRRVVERTSDKLGRSKSLGSKSQHPPKTQRASSNGSSKRFVSQSRKGKSPQTANTGDLGGTFNIRPSYASCALDLRIFQKAVLQRKWQIVAPHLPFPVWIAR